MQVILLERVEKLGIMGDVVEVKPGYARNFLLPQKKALRATNANIAHFNEQKKVLEAANIKRREEAEMVAGRMSNLSVNVVRQASETGHLYGSVRNQDITESMRAAGYDVARTQVILVAPIKTLGIHTAKVVLHPEVSISINVVVAQSEEEATLLKQGAEKPVDA